LIKIATELDVPVLNDVYAHDDVWPWISDDYTPEKARYTLGSEVVSLPRSLILTDGKGVAFLFKIINGITFDVHIAILPDARGTHGIECGKMAVEWIFKYTTCRKIIGYLPVTNRRAIHYALKCGFEKEGCIKKSFFKNGELIDQHLVGRSK